MKNSCLIPLSIGAVCCVLLIGCSSNAPSNQPVEVVEALGPPQKLETSSQTIDHQRIMQVIQLLDYADAAVKAKRLTTPYGDNAWGYYRDVLALMPSNQEALDGLDNIVTRYLQWSRSAQRKGDLASAETYLNRARQVLPRDPRIKAAQQRLAAAPPPQRLPVKIAVTGKDGVYVLDVGSVKKQSAQMKAQLAGIADEIYTQNARVQIFAPTDRMGRWIYQQLNNRHEDFRVRANLKIAKQAKVTLLN